MNRIVKIITIFLLCIISTSVYAKDINDVACTYLIKNPIGDTMAYAEIQIAGYNNGEGGRLVIHFQDQSGKYVNYSSTGPTYDWMYYGKTNAYPNAMLRFMTTDKNGKTFISNYKKSGKCPTIYSNVNSDGTSVDVENHVLNPENPSGTAKALNASSESLRTTGEEWTKKEDFFKDDSGQTTVKDDLVCNYDMEFDMYNIKTPVEFRTIYNPTNGSKSYRISVNGSGQTYTDLNTDAALSLGQGGSGIVYITSAELKKIFKDGSCYDRSKVYHYYDMASSRYIITTNQKEASENGTAGRYDNGDGSNDGAGGTISAPDLSIEENSMTCEEILGPGVTAIVSLFITGVRIAAVIAATVIAMINFIPPIMNGNPDGELKKAFNKTAKLFFILVIVVGFPSILSIIGKLFEFDLSCIF